MSGASRWRVVAIAGWRAVHGPNRHQRFQDMIVRRVSRRGGGSHAAVTGADTNLPFAPDWPMAATFAALLSRGGPDDARREPARRTVLRRGPLSDVSAAARRGAGLPRHGERSLGDQPLSRHRRHREGPGPVHVVGRITTAHRR